LSGAGTGAFRWCFEDEGWFEIYDLGLGMPAEEI
jgi:hypothetical protein